MADPAYSVRRSDRARRARLTVTREGDAVVVLPRRAPAAVAHELVAAHATWLIRQLDRVRSANARLADRPSLEQGRTLSVAGELYRVVLNSSASARSCVLVHRPVAGMPGILEVRQAGRSPATPKEILEMWLRREARRVLLERVRVMAPTVGVSAPRVTIRSQRSRWGSASRTAGLSLNWRLILAPPWVLEYVVIHELVHLAVSGHSARFWELVRRHSAEVDAARAWLRRNHVELLSALD